MRTYSKRRTSSPLGYLNWITKMLGPSVVYTAAAVLLLSSVSAQDEFCGGLIVPREEWGARAPNAVSYTDDYLPYMFIHHTVTSECSNFDDCAEQMRIIQNYHMDSNGWSDIGYSFLVGGDGKIYEGRGWNVVGAHTSGYNSVGYI